jgi:hypothetical protein
MIKLTPCPCGGPVSDLEVCSNAISCPCGWQYIPPDDNISEEALAEKWNTRAASGRDEEE